MGRKYVGQHQNKNKNKWLTPETWRKTDDIRMANDKMLSEKFSRLIERPQEEYKGKEVKRSAHRDQRSFVEELASAAEKAAEKGELRTVTKQICAQGTNKSTQVKEKRNDYNNRTHLSCKMGYKFQNNFEQA